MKIFLLPLAGLITIQSSLLYANFSGNPELAEVSAKHAKLRAKLKATTGVAENSNAGNITEEQATTTFDQQLNSSSDGCNLNVGNVLIDDSIGNSPDEVIVIIEGDIIQSNNCR